MTYVYWIYNESCLTIENDGYVGVTRDVDRRFKAHQHKNDNIPNDVKIKVVYEGTRKECFEYELLLRPTVKIGWNLAIGGSHGWKIGFSHSEKTKKKMEDAWTEERRAAASILRFEQNKLLIGQKRPKQSEAMRGNKNPMFERTHTAASRELISKSNIGRTPHNKIELYCIVCHNRASPSILKKYHGVGKITCKSYFDLVK